MGLLSQQLQPGSGLNIFVLSHGGRAVFGQIEPLDETVLRSNPPKIFLKRGNTHTLFQFVLTPLANRLVTPVGAMRSFKLNVWMMTLSKRSFSECWGMMCQLLGQQQEPGSGHFIYIPSHGGRDC